MFKNKYRFLHGARFFENTKKINVEKSYCDYRRLLANELVCREKIIITLEPRSTKVTKKIQFKNGKAKALFLKTDNRPKNEAVRGERKIIRPRLDTMSNAEMGVAAVS